MDGLLIDPRQATAIPVENVHPADVVGGKGHVIHSHNLPNGDTLFYRHGDNRAWSFVNGKRFGGELFLAGGHTSIEQFKRWFSFGYVEEVI